MMLISSDAAEATYRRTIDVKPCARSFGAFVADEAVACQRVDWAIARFCLAACQYSFPAPNASLPHGQDDEITLNWP